MWALFVRIPHDAPDGGGEIGWQDHDFGIIALCHLAHSVHIALSEQENDWQFSFLGRIGDFCDGGLSARTTLAGVTAEASRRPSAWRIAADFSPSARVTVARLARSAAACSSMALHGVRRVDVLDFDCLEHDAPVGDVVGNGLFEPSFDPVT